MSIPAAGTCASSELLRMLSNTSGATIDNRHGIRSAPAHEARQCPRLRERRKYGGQVEDEWKSNTNCHTMIERCSQMPHFRFRLPSIGNASKEW